MLRRALQEYEEELELHADRADYLNQRALLRLKQQRPDEAEEQWRLALQRDPLHSSSYLNLADLLRAQAREPEAERLLRNGLGHLPGDAILHYALGLSLVRQQQNDQGIAGPSKLTSCGQRMPESHMFLLLPKSREIPIRH